MTQRQPWYERRGLSFKDASGNSLIRLRASLTRSGDDLLNGLFVELDAWQWHMFRIDPLHV
jgi:hypothetical protein